MKIADVIEGGLTGITTLSLLQEALHKVDDGSARPLIHKSDTLKKLKKGKKSGHKASALYVKLAGELLAHAAYFGLSGLGKRKNAIWRGGLLGAAAGLGVAFLEDEANEKMGKSGVDESGRMISSSDKDALQDKIVTVLLYTAGGILAGTAIKHIDKKTVKKNKLLKSLKKKNKAKAQIDW